MASAAELSAVYQNFMLSPRRGADVCRICFNLTDGHSCCYACARGQQWLDAFSPISYSIAGEQLHHALASYKRLTGGVAERLLAELAAVLWRHLDAHECCVAAAARVERFELVTAVPSAQQERGANTPLQRILALIEPLADRHEPLLRRSGCGCQPHFFDLRRYLPLRALHGESVLLIDDTWTTGANAQSAAAALKRAGAGKVAAVVIGRYVTRNWRRNESLLRMLERPFDWSRCPLCAAGRESRAVPPSAGGRRGEAPQDRASAAA
jgi:predicted amidophosphoribosyltransferase